MLHGRKILLAVTGGIAAYKVCELARLLLRNHASVQVAMTEAATRFVAPLSFEALTGQMVAKDLFVEGGSGTHHLDMVRGIDLMVIAPATANCIGKLAAGLADDLVSCAALAISGPLLICPAMNAKMFVHQAVQQNLDILRQRGVLVLDPEMGEMASPHEEPGWGRLPEPWKILDYICRLLPASGPLNGRTITITAGPTIEPVDPVRVISNLSSGRMGYALASEAKRRGARVNLITGPISLHTPPGLSPVRVESTQQMLEAVERFFSDSDVLIMAAAPADFRVSQTLDQKIKKRDGTGELTLKLVPTPDILKKISERKSGKILVGFALETEHGIENARIKLKEKRLDIIVLNSPKFGEVAGIGRDAISGTIIDAQDRVQEFPIMPKSQFAGIILDHLQRLLPSA
ncbi:MAG: bifunctional phosphopantothenoylcysteine decarboxylase/phosphopantothenate--cysteine ligase CoaBC [bacterium]|nr:bifunctional phosphopantothenoylcysteine decarboxylase/phosphopantothenate--cysteine ligase CoaBC [bacterium]